ncbi:MAG: PHP domain-containing protein [Chitinispirillia bacterium]|nr:PHP domain-containing protein [Chitinispirillia bacterium]MCL2268618.1 PHP domain-containing protein [Chitinispirillia bacterium]
MLYKADLHVHSCLSPCASLDMAPSAIVARAMEVGINCLALTDHNSAGNCAAMANLCERNGILFFPGMEVTTAEEAHIVCLFGEVGAAMELGRIVYGKLPDIENNPDKFGDQVLVNEEDEVEGFEERYLGVACGLTIDQLRQHVFALGGLFIAAHVDKPCFSVISQLGFLSGEFSATELSRAGAMREKSFNLVKGYTAVSASDSHYLHTLGSAYVEFEPEEAGIEGYGQALRDNAVKLVILDDAFRTMPWQHG